MIFLALPIRHYLLLGIFRKIRNRECFTIWQSFALYWRRTKSFDVFQYSFIFVFSLSSSFIVASDAWHWACAYRRKRHLRKEFIVVIIVSELLFIYNLTNVFHQIFWQRVIFKKRFEELLLSLNISHEFFYCPFIFLESFLSLKRWLLSWIQIFSINLFLTIWAII